MRKNFRKNGFTLIELLVAVLVIGIISALVYPKFSPVKERTYVSAMKNTLNKAITAQENFMDKNNQYTTTVAAGGLQDVGFKVDDGVSLSLSAADVKYGFTASTTHVKTKAKCSVSYGSAGPTGPEYDGKIVCTAS